MPARAVLTSDDCGPASALGSRPGRAHLKASPPCCIISRHQAQWLLPRKGSPKYRLGRLLSRTAPGASAASAPGVHCGGPAADSGREISVSTRPGNEAIRSLLWRCVLALLGCVEQAALMEKTALLHCAGAAPPPGAARRPENRCGAAPTRPLCPSRQLPNLTGRRCSSADFGRVDAMPVRPFTAHQQE